MEAHSRQDKKKRTDEKLGLKSIGINVTPAINLGVLWLWTYEDCINWIYKSLVIYANLLYRTYYTVNVIKMNILPKLVYRFQSVPLPPKFSEVLFKNEATIYQVYLE